MSASLIIGFALYWAWLFCAGMNSSHVFFPAVSGESNTLLVSSTVFFILTLLPYALFIEPTRALFATPKKRSRNRMIAATSAFGGMLLCLFVSGAPEAAFAITAVAGALIGFGAAVLLMSYGVSFSVCDLPTVTICTAVSIPLGALFFVGIMLLNSFWAYASAVVCMTLPFLQLVCLKKCSANLVDKLEFKSITIPVRSAPFALHIFAPSFVFGIPIGLLRAYTVLLPDGSEFLEALSPMILAAAAFVFLAVVGALITQHHANNFAFRTLMPVAALLVAFLAIPGIEGSEVSLFCLIATYFIVETCMWIMHSDISERFRISPFTVFGFGRCALALGTLIGYQCAAYLGPVAGTRPNTAMFIAIMFACCTLGVALLPTNHEMRGVLKRGSISPTPLTPEDYRLDVLENTVDETESRESAKGLSETLGELDMSDEPAPANPSPSAKTVDNHSANSSAADGGAARGKTDAARHASNETGASGHRQPVSDAKAAMMSQAQPPTAANDQEPIRRTGWFKRKCAVIADRYLLSRRETEVLFLLAKGRSSTAIQENLFISEGTANTHMRHIYRKLDVHSQSELIDLVESVELDD